MTEQSQVTQQTIRRVSRVIRGLPTSDGAGAELIRMIGQPAVPMLDPFQLWVKLPAGHKMDKPAYQEHPAKDIPREQRDQGARVRVIAGETASGTRGPVVQPLTEPLYLDVELPQGVRFDETLPRDHNAFAYVIHGVLDAEDADGAPVRLVRDDLAILSQGEGVSLLAGDLGARVLLIAGRPLNEPVARGGPFVMNTRAEIRQAYEDYESGRF